MVRKINAEILEEALKSGNKVETMPSLSSEEILDLKFFFMKVARAYCPDFRVTEENREVINDLFCWALMLPGKYDPQRGLLLHGSIGSGKTTMLEIVRRFAGLVRPYDDEGNPYSFRTSKTTEVAAAFNAKGYDGIRSYVESRRQAFDDLGCEPTHVNYYGTAVNVMEHVIMSRYGRMDTFTHITTNLPMERIKQVYGARVYDRCREMFNIVELRCRSFRAPDE